MKLFSSKKEWFEIILFFTSIPLWIFYKITKKNENNKFLNSN